MPKLRFIDIYPQSGPFDEWWEDSAPVDAVTRTARRVCEAHSAGLRSLELEAPRASYRLLPREVDAGDPLRVELLDDLKDHNVGSLLVPADAHNWAPQARAAAVLEAIHRATVLLGARLGWNRAELAEVRDQVAAAGGRFSWESKWRHRPDRSSRARVRAVWADDGFGRLSVQVEGAEGARYSAPVIAFSTPEGLLRSANALRWLPDTRWILPTLLPFGIPDGEPQVIAAGAWLDEDPLRQLPTPAGTFAAPVPVIAAWRDPDESRLDDLYIATVADAWGTPPEVFDTIDRISDSLPRLLRQWLEDAGVRDLEWFYEFDGNARTGLRVLDRRPVISIFQRRSKTDLQDPATCAKAIRDDLQRALDRVAAKLDNGPAPQLPH